MQFNTRSLYDAYGYLGILFNGAWSERKKAGDREEKNCQTPNPGFRTGKQKPEMQKQQENRQVNYRVRKTS